MAKSESARDEYKKRAAHEWAKHHLDSGEPEPTTCDRSYEYYERDERIFTSGVLWAYDTRILELESSVYALRTALSHCEPDQRVKDLEWSISQIHSSYQMAMQYQRERMRKLETEIAEAIGELDWLQVDQARDRLYELVKLG